MAARPPRDDSWPIWALDPHQPCWYKSAAVHGAALWEAATLREKLKALAELQNVDLEVASLRKAADVHPRQIAELERELGAARSAIEAERTRVAEIERQKTQ